MMCQDSMLSGQIKKSVVIFCKLFIFFFLFFGNLDKWHVKSREFSYTIRVTFLMRSLFYWNYFIQKNILVTIWDIKTDIWCAHQTYYWEAKLERGLLVLVNIQGIITIRDVKTYIRWNIFIIEMKNKYVR